MSTRFIQGTPVNYQGRTDGAAVPAGMIGERIVSSGVATSTPSSSTAYGVRSITLTPGVWMLYASFTFGASVNGTITRSLGGIGPTANSTSGWITSIDFSIGPTTTANIDSTAIAYVNISSNTTYHANAYFIFSSGTYQANATMFAVRIA